MRDLLSTLAPADRLVILFALLLSVLAAAAGGRLPGWPLLVALNLAWAAGVVSLAAARSRRDTPLLRQAHLWSVAPAAYLAFREVHVLVPALRGGVDFDALLIAADRAVFSADPTVWLGRLAHPMLTEVLQIAYTMFYLLFFILGLDLQRRGGEAPARSFLFTALYGFFLSYLGYFLLPAVGPRFTLHDHAAINTDLPGLLLTPALRWFVDAGGGVPLGAAPAEVLARAPRDVFPSGHTMMTLVVMITAVRRRARTAPFLLVTGGLLIVATVYLRYHYVVDLVAAVLFLAVCLATAGPLERLLGARARG